MSLRDVCITAYNEHRSVRSWDLYWSRKELPEVEFCDCRRDGVVIESRYSLQHAARWRDRATDFTTNKGRQPLQPQLQRCSQRPPQPRWWRSPLSIGTTMAAATSITITDDNDDGHGYQRGYHPRTLASSIPSLWSHRTKLIGKLQSNKFTQKYIVIHRIDERDLQLSDLNGWMDR